MTMTLITAILIVTAASVVVLTTIAASHPAWQCPQCGALNDDRTDICSKCGDVRP